MPDNNHPSSQQNAIVFIDSTVPDYESLAGAVEEGTQVIILDRTRDAIEQITEVLASRNGTNAVHIVSHGSPGSLHFGKTQLNSDNLHTYAPQLQQWRNALTDDADILIYGCDVGRNLTPQPPLRNGEGAKYPPLPATTEGVDRCRYCGFP